MSSKNLAIKLAHIVKATSKLSLDTDTIIIETMADKIKNYKTAVQISLKAGK